MPAVSDAHRGPEGLAELAVAAPVTVSDGGLEVQYHGNGRRVAGALRMESPPGALVGNAPVDSRIPLYYYEITVLSAIKHPEIGLGFADAGSRCADIMPGWRAGTYGYHGDDGQKV